MNERVTFRIPKALLADVDRLVERGEYKNRSVAVRDGLKQLDGVGEPQRTLADGGTDD